MTSRETLDDIARDGFEHREPGTTCTYPEGSTSWLVWHFGAYMHRTGRTMPRNVSRGRGHSVRANDMLFTLAAEEDINGPVFIRVE